MVADPALDPVAVALAYQWFRAPLGSVASQQAMTHFYNYARGRNNPQQMWAAHAATRLLGNRAPCDFAPGPPCPGCTAPLD